MTSSRLIVLLLCWMALPNPDGLGMVLTNDPKQTQSIRIPSDADARMVQAAEDLSQRLEKIFGKPFPVEIGQGEGGIILGTVKEFPEYEDKLKQEKPGDSEAYLIKSQAGRILLVGASPLGVQNASWDFLYQLGYRHYFPGNKWEIFPSLDRIDVTLDVASRPAFVSREIFAGNGLSKDAAQEVAEWKKHNRLDYGFRLFTGHAYDRIISRNREAFLKNSDYLTKPLKAKGGDKFNIANENLRQLVLEDALREFKKDPDLNSISLDPSDGGGWPETSTLGSVSDQVVTLANYVASGLREVVPGKKVGIYAYSEHAPAPSITVDPDVVVSVATALITGGQPFEVLMTKWKAKGATLGVRDYLGVWTWHHDLPGKAKAASPDKVAKTIREFYDLGARYYTAETSYCAGPNGLGHFVAARCLWDLSEIERIGDIREEFIEKSFGPASEPMKRFYNLIDGRNNPLLSEHLLGGMYGALSEAYALSTDAAVLSRIDDLAVYTRFVELFREYANSSGADRQFAYDRLVEFAVRVDDACVVNPKGILRDMPVRDRTIVLNTTLLDSGAGRPPGREELQAYLKSGIAKYELLKFDPKAFSVDLVPLQEGDAAPEPGKNASLHLRGKNNLFTYLDQPGASLEFIVESGHLARNLGPVQIRVYPQAHPLGESICDLKIPADKIAHPVIVKSNYSGLHRIEISDGGNLTRLQWPAGQPLAIPSGKEECANLNGRFTLYFFVPKGTRRVGGYASRATGRLLNAQGEERFKFSSMKGAGYFDVPVAQGEDNAVWCVDQGLENVLLMTVPPYITPNKGSLLVPREVNEDTVRAEGGISYAGIFGVGQR